MILKVLVINIKKLKAKKLYIILIIVSFILSCTKDNEEPKNNIPAELIGKWKLTEKNINYGGREFNWVEVDTGMEYDIWLKENKEVIMTTNNENCRTGTYRVVENKINFNFPCFGESTIPIDSLSNTTLITNVSYIEYELNKYIKIVE